MTVYLDHAASSPMVPEAVAAVTSWLEGGYGNPSGAHSVARRARRVVEDARDTVAAFAGAEPSEVVFTSGGTEADNLAVLGPLAARRGALVVSAVEHPAVLEAARASGREVRMLGVDAGGVVDLDQLRSLCDPPVAVVSVQAANHETGVIQPVGDIARRVRRWAPGALFHTDAVQAAGWLDLREACGDADLVSVSAHKLGGPQGVGALIVRRGAEVAPLLHGGGQERERRSGTQNVAGIAGFAAAVAALPARTPAPAVAALRDQLARSITGRVPGCSVTAAGSRRLPGHCHLRFRGVEIEELVFLLDRAGVCASAGPACSSGAVEPSPVLMAMGLDKQEATGLRLTLGRETTEDDVGRAAAAVIDAVGALREAAG